MSNYDLVFWYTGYIGWLSIGLAFWLGLIASAAVLGWRTARFVLVYAQEYWVIWLYAMDKSARHEVANACVHAKLTGDKKNLSKDLRAIAYALKRSRRTGKRIIFKED